MSHDSCRDIEAEGDKGLWRCDQMPGGATCRSSAGEWGAAIRRKAQQARVQAASTVTPMQVPTHEHNSECMFMGEKAVCNAVQSCYTTAIWIAVSERMFIGEEAVCKTVQSCYATAT